MSLEIVDLENYHRKNYMDLKRITVGLLIAFILCILFITLPANNIFCLILILLISSFALWEFYNLLAIGGIPSSKKIGVVSGLIFSIGTWYYMIGHLSDNIIWSIMVLIVLITFYRLLIYHNMRNGLEHGLGTFLGFIYIPFLFSFFIRIFLSCDDLNQPAFMGFYFILCTKISDTGGYFIGSKFGKNKLAKNISPKKTWEGFFGGIIFCLVINIIWWKFIGKNTNSFIPLIHSLILSFLFPLFGTIGDLVESLFKRAVDQKDSSSITYGIGGILDMIDSILFTAPMFYIYLTFFLA